ncbi:right-handed parallel beta-helix repeat-containing protein [Fulvivirga sp. 29W222]|uniref:Right-handed parallel beta-helix repeat-containing protein n=1 Tax=Fulvivirga marina TaxID=2494733 RepID=A0A937FXJ4_9BACT|nr:right-handed parallel beta-helix repeat-containing protein [Fulvivirga marina]MBL6446220.1 right-handed parallel beta-helix repeat-containing protein [Fulvivirga marina]
MKKTLLVIFVFLAFMACKPEEEKLTFDSNVSLRFSTDTIFFDTVFTRVNTEIRNITKRLKVYNDSDNAVEIESIALRKPTSPYTIYVNGRPSSSFENTKLLGNDSLLLLVQVTIDPMDENLPFIVSDEISFLTNNNKQGVQLVAWGQDANFLRDSVLACNVTWTNDRPYVIYNSLLIDSLCSLTIEPGTKVYSHNGSYIFIKGTIDVQGEAENRVLFRNDRLDFKEVPGQWGGIIFLPGSKNNNINYTDIRNAEVGIYLGTPDEDTDPDLVVGNSTIENIGGNTKLPINGGLILPGYGILAITSDMYVYNTLINNCAINTLGNYAGGSYRYEHCTFANYSFDFFREDPSVVFADNLVVGEDALLVDDLEVELANSVIWGSLKNEIIISSSGQANFSLSMSNNLLKTSDSELNVNDNIINEDPNFLDPRDHNYRLDTLSPAKDKGIILGLSTDHDGNPRDDLPDLGAFERIEN